ncbi:MAG: hypothetical protein Q8Q73_18670 [Stagnimonas sp.]|nr:hypothetical protein [Stagnimonas sp.]
MRPLRSCLIIAALLLTTPAWAITADELVTKNVEAKGGTAAMQAVQGLRRSGKLIIGGGRFIAGIVEIKQRPAAIRAEFSLQGLTQVQAYDGKSGWQIDPFQGRKDAENMAPDDVKGLVEDADIDGPMVDYRAKGHTLEYLGTEDIDGTPAHKLKLVRGNGDLQYIYLDPDHFLEIRIENQRSVRGVKQIGITDFGNYEKVGGVFWPMSMELFQKGSSDKQVIEYEQAEVNPALAASLFQFPASK